MILLISRRLLLFCFEYFMLQKKKIFIHTRYFSYFIKSFYIFAHIIFFIIFNSFLMPKDHQMTFHIVLFICYLYVIFFLSIESARQATQSVFLSQWSSFFTNSRMNVV